ncbi:hypothetical protein [Umezawaea sp. Da 62-37]|uniref:hypothetical protein n=1 Tax=Umezawaea sp. Da 62-37 TaxID=3075927 RepID=UPI0028F6D928|nr:hypothetical protein [Umezawaea sp. Da 62-37]WNV88874.1 hypothetical protein RM788_11405 [Umezawaea sp. Da 62-37]
MTDLDALRSALRGTAGDSPSVDVARVMESGRRIRARRRLVLGGGVVGGTAALLVGIIALGGIGPGIAPSPTVEITAALPGDSAPVRVGEVIGTGFDDEVLYFVAGYRDRGLSDPSATVSAKESTLRDVDTGYALVLGTGDDHRAAQTTPLYARGTGFTIATTHDGTTIRLYGCYQGPVHRIVLELDDQVMGAAHQAQWSADGTMTVFWFTPDDIPAGSALDNMRLTAYDERGNRLPT